KQPSRTELKIENKKLKQNEGIDPLTGLLNRHGFYDRIKPILGRDRPYGLIMLDLDKFKEINDIYGHSGGDAVLVNTADILRRQTRDVDLICRWGGEEILILMPDDVNDLKILTERLREQLEVNQVRYGEVSICRTASFGVTVGHGGYEQLNKYINMADEAMYQAKQSGRNRVVVAQSV
ncbi:MAG: GGDEF domain-containing protein, partial [Candidatus Subteraquimicrobiales bacterium]|nr:GGDEF domain-containing protein [Candidatus Subteraquimicrobiales bacterium]